MAARKPRVETVTAARDGVKGRKPAAARVFASDAEAMAYLRERVNIETMRPASIEPAKAFRLDRMTALLERLDQPQTKFRSVHVAGSKGKGSVCEMIAAGLGGCGHVVGLYTSPHMLDVRDRIRLGRQVIPMGEFTALLSQAASAAGDLPKALGEVSYFEVLTAVAFLYFAEQQVDLAVIEVGLGGRHDATNVIRPEVCAIAAVQPEHLAVLGPRLEDIAGHKAGIMKAGVPVVSAMQAPAVAAVLEAEAAKVGCTLSVLGKSVDFSYRFESSHDLGPHMRVSVSGPAATFEHVPVPYRGEHQAMNCGVALGVIERLAAEKLAVTPARVIEGLASTPANGRLEQVRTSPRVFVDGAHTPESIHAVMRALGAQVKYDSMVCVFGCAADKDIAGMLKALATGADKVIFTRAADHARAADPRDLLRRFGEASGKSAQIAPTVKQALHLAGLGVNKGDLVIVTGSFAVAGEAKRLLCPVPPTPDPGLREVKPSGIAPSAPGSGG